MIYYLNSQQSIYCISFKLMKSQNEDEHMIIGLIRTLFTAKLSKRSTSSTFLALLVFVNIFGIIIGSIYLSLPTDKGIVIQNYGNHDSCKTKKENCEITFRVDEDLEAPVYVYYQLQNFIANSKDYLTSKSRKQLDGHPITAEEAHNCKPYVTNSEMEVTSSWGGYSLDPNAVASPCGLQAKLYFRDTFQLRSLQGRSIQMRTSNLLKMFLREPKSEQMQWIDPTSDSFVIWMTTSVSPVLQKLYGVLNETVTKGNYTFRINNTMNYGVGVQKHLVLYKTRNELGDSKLVGYMILGGSISLLLLIILYTVCITSPCKCGGRR